MPRFLFPAPAERGMSFALHEGVHETNDDWALTRDALLGRRISELGLTLGGTPIEPLVSKLYDELAAKGLRFRPPVYLSDEWGCPDGTPRIGVPFYLADARLAKLEEEHASSVESERDIMRFLRHEAGHAFNYAYRLHERTDWQTTFGRFSKPYRERYHADPFSRHYVRHILGWYAQKHPDEDFAETFAVWLTPGLDWRSVYQGWPALQKLEFVERIMDDLGDDVPPVPDPSDDDLPVESMGYTVAEHYESSRERLPIEDPAYFDDDLRDILADRLEAPDAPMAGDFIRRHHRELVRRIAHWTAEAPSIVGDLIEHLAVRADALRLTAPGREAATLIELTAFGTAVIMRYRYHRTRPAGGSGRSLRPSRLSAR